MITIAAACLLDDTGRLLLVRKRGTHAFMLPGGKHETGETPVQALLRELQEELDLRLEENALKPLGRFQADAANEPNMRVDAHVFVATLPHPVQPAAELEELAWLDTASDYPQNLAPLLREQVLPALLQHLG
ncbi:NUDIX domain-containing protein [Pseudomonas sp. ZM23]|uniref:NUDIX domain-containing protein n=1 Tax=Pseudomonas triclosanedens TaxID=2961893 RepID=A0ABY7A2L6_9PSED|nr:NUDIX domain-containing protein [Pseudomonas triclosanedens]MCP8464784.1 NUDIX domain-containing protein [Pseudomonas triclosanedens]MCP8470503.1 NUDIX domain-containing protein [Pseudomonas triclosanedens]MCP8476309.1 NUDIX domain-containing protein [Pseudomonas triclosanedens]WAI51462.1 NUDIX domain-containing protein [Pseudomonas triclosanedens]